MEDEVSFGWSRSPSDSLEAAGFLAASLAVQQPLKQQLRKEGEEEPGSASGRSLQSSFRTGTSSSYLMQPAEQTGLQQSVWWECGGWTLPREKKPSPLWMSLHPSKMLPPSPVLIPARGRRIFFPIQRWDERVPPTWHFMSWLNPTKWSS